MLECQNSPAEWRGTLRSTHPTLYDSASTARRRFPARRAESQRLALEPASQMPWRTRAGKRARHGADFQAGIGFGAEVGLVGLVAAKHIEHPVAAIDRQPQGDDGPQPAR